MERKCWSAMCGRVLLQNSVRSDSLDYQRMFDLLFTLYIFTCVGNPLSWITELSTLRFSRRSFCCMDAFREWAIQDGLLSGRMFRGCFVRWNSMYNLPVVQQGSHSPILVGSCDTRKICKWQNSSYRPQKYTGFACFKMQQISNRVQVSN